MRRLIKLFLPVFMFLIYTTLVLTTPARATECTSVAGWPTLATTCTISTSNVTANNLVVNTGGLIIISAGKKLTLTGTMASSLTTRIFQQPLGLAITSDQMDLSNVTLPSNGATADWFGVIRDNSAQGVADTNTSIFNTTIFPICAGKKVYFINGSYYVSGHIDPRAYTTLNFESRSAFIKGLPTVTGNKIIFVDGKDYVTIQHGSVDCGDDGGATRKQAIAVINNSNYTTITDMRTQGCGQYGILIGNPDTQNGGGDGSVISYNYVDMSYATGTNGIGIEIFPKHTDELYTYPGVQVNNNEVVASNTNPGVGSSALITGIKMSEQDHGAIYSNSVSGVQSSMSTGGIDIAAGNKYTSAYNNTITNCRIGVVIGGGNDSRGNRQPNTNISVNSNLIQSPSQVMVYGIYSSQAPTGTSLSYNTIKGVGMSNSIRFTLAAGGDWNTLPPYAATNLSICYNHLYDSGMYLLRGTSGGSYIGYPYAYIYSNTIAKSSDTVPVSNHGFRMEKVDGAYIIGNISTKINQSGIYVAYTTGFSSFSSNQVFSSHNTGSSAIYLDNTTVNDVSIFSGNDLENRIGENGNMAYAFRMVNGSTACGALSTCTGNTCVNIPTNCSNN